MLKGVISLPIALIILISSAYVTADTESLQLSTTRTGYSMKVENSSATPGTIGHNIEITGTFEEEINRTLIYLKYGPTQGIGDINITEVNLNGCIGEDNGELEWYYNDNGDYGVILSIIDYPNGVPGPDEGKLINIVVDIAETAELQVVDINFYMSILNYYRLSGGGYGIPLLINGTLEIINPPTPDLNVKSIIGGKGVTVIIENNGTGNATDLEVNITIQGGFIILPSEYEYPNIIGAGEEVEITMSVFGIGLGIFTPIPEITVTADCYEESSDEDSAEATIFFSKVTIQD
jgi:hypothetical protein